MEIRRKDLAVMDKRINQFMEKVMHITEQLHKFV